jgi:hypothetical protein
VERELAIADQLGECTKEELEVMLEELMGRSRKMDAHLKRRIERRGEKVENIFKSQSTLKTSQAGGRVRTQPLDVNDWGDVSHYACGTGLHRF